MISEGRNNHLLSNWKCLAICFIVSMANCQYGFGKSYLLLALTASNSTTDTAAVAGLQAMVGFLQVFGYQDPESETGWNIHTKPQQLISSFLNVGTIVGVLLANPFAHKFGRKPAIWIAAAVSLVACSVQIGTSNLGGLYAGRILLGLSNGFFILFSNTYTVEVAPARHRAILGSFFGFWVNTGSILGAVADNYSSRIEGKLAYRIPLACLFAIPTILSICLVVVPESPRMSPPQAVYLLQTS
jgi:MFS family permease